MPGAVAGSENSNNYLYSINALPADVASFYIQELAKLAWEPNPSSGTPESSGVIKLLYLSAQEICLVTIIPQTDGTLVMLGRQQQ